MNKRKAFQVCASVALPIIVAACSQNTTPESRTTKESAPSQATSRFLIISANDAHPGVWRVDTGTGALDFCELEALIGFSIRCTAEAPSQLPSISEGDINALAGSPPKIGEVRDGYRFIGGNPDKKESWEPASNPSHPWKQCGNEFCQALKVRYSLLLQRFGQAAMQRDPETSRDIVSTKTYQAWWWYPLCTVLIGFFWWDGYEIYHRMQPPASLFYWPPYWYTLAGTLTILWALDRRFYRPHRLTMDRLRKDYERRQKR